jgi:aspartate aminotransferase
MKAEGKDVIGLAAGEPDFDTPHNIKDAAIKAIKAGKTKYTAVDGIPELKKAIVRQVQARERPRLQAVAGDGRHRRQAGAVQRLMATVNPGDEVIVPAPYWVSYPDIVMLAGGTPVFVDPAKTASSCRPRTLEKAITPKTKWLILNSPSNPSGAAYTREKRA